MTIIQTYFEEPIKCNSKRFWTIIALMVILINFVVVLKIIQNTITFTPPLAKVRIISSVKKSLADIFYPNIAVIVEFRAVDHLIAVVHNVNYHIPASWPIQIFHGTENEYFIRSSTLAPLIETEKVFLTLMNETFEQGRTNELLTTPAFWEQVCGEKILFFQIDSAMCSNSPHKITDFLQYDYIGAPWDLSWFSFNKTYRVGNGGFSLRTRSKILALLALVPYNTRMPEDVWYAQNMQWVNGSIPPVEIAKTFAVESVYYDRPLGVHKSGWTPEFRAKLASTRPESMLIKPKGSE